MDAKTSPRTFISGMHEDHMSHESLVRELQDDTVRADYAAAYDHYKTCLLYTSDAADE